MQVQIWDYNQKECVDRLRFYDGIAKGCEPIRPKYGPHMYLNPKPGLNGPIWTAAR